MEMARSRKLILWFGYAIAVLNVMPVIWRLWLR